MTRKVGRYTKDETAELTRMFGKGYSVYKICRNLNRSQNSIRNNLIKLDLIEGEISPRQNSNRDSITELDSRLDLLTLSYAWYLFQICFFSVIFVLNPHFNFLETILYYIVSIILLI